MIGEAAGEDDWGGGMGFIPFFTRLLARMVQAVRSHKSGP
jgi:hypothetical protein